MDSLGSPIPHPPVLIHAHGLYVVTHAYYLPDGRPQLARRYLRLVCPVRLPCGQVENVLTKSPPDAGLATVGAFRERLQ